MFSLGAHSREVGRTGLVTPTFFFFRQGKFSKAAQLKAGSIQSLEEPCSSTPTFFSPPRHGGRFEGLAEALCLLLGVLTLSAG